MKQRHTVVQGPFAVSGATVRHNKLQQTECGWSGCAS